MKTKSGEREEDAGWVVQSKLRDADLASAGFALQSPLDHLAHLFYNILMALCPRFALLPSLRDHSMALSSPPISSFSSRPLSSDTLPRLWRGYSNLIRTNRATKPDLPVDYGKDGAVAPRFCARFSYSPAPQPLRSEPSSRLCYNRTLVLIGKRDS